MPKRVDSNQAMIVEALRRAGCDVVLLHEHGRGVPDLLVTYAGRTLLMEVKVPGKRLNKRQVEFRATWSGELAVVTTPLEALAALRLAQPILTAARHVAQTR